MVSYEAHATAYRNTAAVSGHYSACPYAMEGVVSHVSNPVVTYVLKVTAAKTVSPVCARRGDIVTYTIEVGNESDVPIYNVLIKDPETQARLSVHNLRLDGKTVEPDVDLKSGLQIPMVAGGSRVTMSYDALVKEIDQTALLSVATVSYEYDAGGKRHQAEITSNPAELILIHPEIDIVKTADKTIITADGETVTYLLTVKNTGNLLLTNVVVTDALPMGMTYVARSTRINDNMPVNANPTLGIFLGELEAGGTATIRFSVTAAN